MGIRFKFDENLPHDAEALLRDAGHEVDTALAEDPGGHPDVQIFEACRREGRVLITLDLDFSDIRLYPTGTHNGIWVLRPGFQSIGSILALLRGALALLESESPRGHLWVLEPGRVRIRD